MLLSLICKLSRLHEFAKKKMEPLKGLICASGTPKHAICGWLTPPSHCRQTGDISKTKWDKTAFARISLEVDHPAHKEHTQLRTCFNQLDVLQENHAPKLWQTNACLASNSWLPVHVWDKRSVITLCLSDDHLDGHNKSMEGVVGLRRRSWKHALHVCTSSP